MDFLAVPPRGWMADIWLLLRSWMAFIFLEELCPILAFVFMRALCASLQLSSPCFGCTFLVPGVGFGPAHFCKT